MSTSNHLLRQARERQPSSARPGQPMSRADLARRVTELLKGLQPGVTSPFDANYVGKLERGEIRWPDVRYRDALREVLDVATDADLGFHDSRIRSDNVSDLYPQRAQNGDLASTSGAFGSGEEATNRRTVLAIPLLLTYAARTSREIAKADPDPLTVTEIEDDIELIATEYAITPHGEIFSLVERRWTQVDQALAGRVSLATRGRLTRAAGQLSYYLSRLAFNCGEFNAARQIAVLAEQYARQVDDKIILASVAGMRSGIAYYRGQHEAAVAVFRDYPPDPPYLAARNAAYRARAYGRIGNISAAKTELEHMWRTGVHTPPAPGDLPLGEAAMSMFAGWTHAFIGEGDRAEGFARESLASHEALGSRASREEWAHALLLLGYSLLNRKHPIIDEAAGSAASAIDTICEYPTYTVIQRTEDLAVSLRGYRSSPAVMTLYDRLHSTLRPASIRS